ncbi:unnamed protein product [Schistosoma mattheei]|uniref:Uncharacterized protein n=1 Tax=Schistosoma mattheei TaxID=31246 RepID=A0A183Q003_9TREM|nr:unnamed protein product [Schistosoma mattheei]
MEDVRTSRGADIASDHHLVVAKMKMKLKKHWTTGETLVQRFNTAFLLDNDKPSEFKIALNNRFQALRDTVEKKRNHDVEQLERDGRSTNFNVSRGAELQ